ncbi:MAG: NUDIX domain-containing protein [Flavobacteriaceae bacterium]|nr:NUDIX domain-containing protein [Flavobacteriaceae bacterium]
MSSNFSIQKHVQKYKVSIDDIIVCLTGKKEKSKSNRLYLKASSVRLKHLRELITDLGVNELFLYTNNLNKLIYQFEDSFETIYAAGGVVRNKHNELLMIYRRGKWDLPKGKIDPGESALAAAIREVKEETGVKKLKPKRLLNITRYLYRDKGMEVLKIVYWYAMKTNFTGPLTAQSEEQITEVTWKTKKEVSKIPLEDTYVNIQKLI